MLSQPRTPRAALVVVASVVVIRLALYANLRLRAGWVALLVAVAGALAGCAPVAPYERGWLGRRNMQIGGDDDLTFGEEHARTYREGSTGGGSVRGGGCGCN
jgi:uncharacterized membrane protein YgcG